MANYFNFFPRTNYKISSNNILDVVTNITARFSFEEKIKQNSSAFYEYIIMDGDTPEILASKYYKHPERHWIILLFNDIIDPQYDWPLDYTSFYNYVNEKYTSNADTANTSITGIRWAQNVSNIHSYYKTVIRTSQNDGISIKEKLEINQTEWANTGNSSVNYVLQDGSSITETIYTETKSYYDYENEINDNKRIIKLLKKEFVPLVEKEFKRVIK